MGIRRLANVPVVAVPGTMPGAVAGQPYVLRPSGIIAASSTQISLAATNSLATRIVTSSATLTVTSNDYAIGLNRSSPGAMTINLPGGVTAGFACLIQDLAGNLQAAPATVTPPAGSIAGLATFVMNVDRMSALFIYYGSNLWGISW